MATVLLLFMFLPLILTETYASLVTFEASPDTLKTNLSDALSMRCSVNNNQNQDVKRIASIFITKNDGDDVASITTFTAPQALTDTNNLATKGDLSPTSGEGDLQLSWINPGLVELSDYQCKVTAVDSKGHTVLLTASLALTSEPPSIGDVIAFFNAKFVAQQQINAEEKDTNVKQKETITKQQEVITKQQEKIAEQEETLSNLTNFVQTLAQESSKQYTEIIKFKTCSSTHVAFHAAISHSRFNGNMLAISNKQTVVWDLVTLNEGGNYDMTTGEFRCTVPGVYVFYVHVQGLSNKRVFLQLEKNGKELVDLAKDGYDSGFEATLSQILSLRAGDVVKVTEDWSNSELYQQNDNTRYSRINYFMGHLIHASDC